ncbi:MAG TPA: hypothetical protein PK339_12535 [Flavitalea sp.]|nr:hypothetical protein [Flavitalea sp.]
MKLIRYFAVFLLTTMLILLFVMPPKQESIIRIGEHGTLTTASSGGGERAYIPIIEGDTTLIYGPIRVAIGPCETELPEGDYMVVMKNRIISIVPTKVTP